MALLFVVAAAIAGRYGGGPAVSGPSPTGAGSGSSAATVAVPSPPPTAPALPASSADLESAVATARLFVEAWGKGDEVLMNALLVPKRRAQSTTSASEDTPPPQEVRIIECLPALERPGLGHAFGHYSDTATAVLVWCKWDVREDWDGRDARPWPVYMLLQRQPPGPWLVEDFQD